MAKNRRKKVINVDVEAASVEDDGEVTDDSFKNANLSLMPEDMAASKLAAALPETKVKAEIQPTNLKIVNRPLMPLNHVQSNLQDGDLQKLANAITMEVN